MKRVRRVEIMSDSRALAHIPKMLNIVPNFWKIYNFPKVFTYLITSHLLYLTAMFSCRNLSIALFLLFLSTLSTAQNLGDCVTAFAVCDQTFLHFKVNEGRGYMLDTDLVPCFMNGENQGEPEENSTWIYFKIQTAGQLSFAIAPDTITDDLDFVLFQLPADGNCDKKQVIRCMAAGDGPNARKSPCMGATGLRNPEKDTEENAGCNDRGDNNWLKPLDAAAGEKYVLLVSNITAPNGFTIRFKGSALLAPCAIEGEKKE